MNIDWTTPLLAASEPTAPSGDVEMALAITGVVMIAIGLFMFVGGAIGLVRFPDFYSRMHAAGKGDTLSTMLIIGGFAVYHVCDVIHAVGHDDWYKPVIVIVKLIGVSLFIMLTSPTSTHALMEAGYEDGIDPQVVKDELKEAKEAQNQAE